MKMDFYVSKVGNVAFNEVLKRTIKKAENLKEKFWIIAPETLSLSVERTILKLSNRTCFTNVQVFSFARLFSKLNGGKYTYVSSQTGTMIVKKIILENLHNFVCFKKTARSQGFVEEMFATIQQLKSSNISPQDFLMMSATKSTALAIKMKDIALIYSKYEEFLGNNILDDSGRLAVLAAILENVEEIKNINIVLVGHENFTAQMKIVIRELIRCAKSTTFGVSYIPKTEANSYITENECFESLKQIGDDLNIKYNSYVVDEDLPEYQNHILKNLFAYPYSKKEIDGKFCVFEAQNPTEEIQYIASIISQKIICEGARFKDFAIACSDTEKYASVIRKIFNDYKIECFIDDPTKLSSHPVFELLGQVFAISKKNFEQEDVLLLSKNMFCTKDIEHCSNFENYVLKFNMNHSDFKNPFVFGKQNFDGTNNEMFLQAEEFRLYIFEKLCELDKKIKSAKNFNEYFDCMYEILSVFDVQDSLSKIAEYQNEQGFVAESKISEQVLSKLEEFVMEARKVLGECEVTTDEFLSILSSGVASVKISLIPVSVDQVFVGDISKCAGAKHMFVVGMQEGAVPFCKDDCGIITDGDIKGLATDFGKKIEPTIKTVNRREKWKFFQGLFGAKENLTFCFCRFGFDGREVAVSPVVKDVSKLFQEDGEAIRYLTMQNFKGRYLADVSKNKLAFWYPNKDLAQKRLIASVSEYKQNINYDNPEIINSLFFACEKHMNLKAKKFFENVNIQKPFEQLIDAKSLFFSNGKTSVSQIETYFDCPFKHFVAYGLRAKEREIAGLKALDVGVIVHAVCERFVKYLKKCENKQIDIKKVSSKILQEVLEEDALKAGTNIFLSSLLDAECFRVCSIIYNQNRNSLFKPVLCEAKFENGKELSSICFDKTDVLLEGKIDRVDRYNNMLFVVDYKTGKIEKSLTKLYYGKQSQLFVYLQAVKSVSDTAFVGAFYMPIRNNFELLKKSSKMFSYRMIGYALNEKAVLDAMDKSAEDLGESLYFPFTYNVTKDGSVKINARSSSVLLKEELDFFVEYARKIIEDAICEICNGNITPSPIKISSTTSCDYCLFKWICRQESNDCLRRTKTKTKKYFTGGEC